MSDDLTSVYTEMIMEKKKKINLSPTTISVYSDANPTSQNALNIEEVFFGLPENFLKKGQNMQSLKLLHKALTTLLKSIEGDKIFYQALRNHLNKAFTDISSKIDNPESKDEKKIKKESYTEFLDTLTEGISFNADTGNRLRKLATSPKSQTTKKYIKAILGLTDEEIKSMPTSSVEMIVIGIANLCDKITTVPSLKMALKKILDDSGVNDIQNQSDKNETKNENTSLFKKLFNSLNEKQYIKEDEQVQSNTQSSTTITSCDDIINEFKLDTDEKKNEFAKAVLANDTEFKNANPNITDFTWKIIEEYCTPERLNYFNKIIDIYRQSLQTKPTISTEPSKEVEPVKESNYKSEFNALFGKPILSELLRPIAGIEDKPQTISNVIAKKTRDLFYQTSKDMGYNPGTILLNSDNATSWEQIDKLVTIFYDLFKIAKQDNDKKQMFLNLKKQLESDEFESIWTNMKIKNKSKS